MIFVVLSIIVIITAVVATVKAFRNASRGIPNLDNEDPRRESRVFAPAGLLPTQAERQLLAE
ncbi:carbon starvation protein [Arthrobacter sp. Hiyo6]|nr:carbon starvation protein [Arthrobacter sp. Hiyo6]